jgi:uncharacterized protein (DUF779 family)
MSHDDAERDVAVTANPAALEAIRRLGAAQGPLIFFHSGGCCDGSPPLCLKDGELPLSPYDVCLSPGPADGFSLEGLEGVHFVTRTGS